MAKNIYIRIYSDFDGKPSSTDHKEYTGTIRGKKGFNQHKYQIKIKYLKLNNDFSQHFILFLSPLPLKKNIFKNVKKRIFSIAK